MFKQKYEPAKQKFFWFLNAENILSIMNSYLAWAYEIVKEMKRLEEILFKLSGF